MEKILDIISEESSEAGKQAAREEQYRRKVINSFMEYGRLKAIPMQRKKERIILEEIAKDIKEGISYSEKEITGIITKYHEDYCTIRRDMISEGILERQGSTYRKCPPADQGKDMGREFLIFTAQDNLQAEMVLDIFRKNNIPAYKKDSSAGGVMNIYSGNSLCGEEIFISEKDREKAAEILADIGLYTS